jgi:hypothetical protein
MRGDIPLAYFFTFRAYGTWLHGDERGSVDRFHNQYGTPFRPMTRGNIRANVALNMLPSFLTRIGLPGNS